MTRDKAMLKITEIIKPRLNCDLRTLEDICSQLKDRMINGTDEPLFELTLEQAKECCKRAQKPIAMFFSLMKQSPFLYQPRKII